MDTIYQHLLNHQSAADWSLYLVPSENSLAKTARLAYVSDMVNRYYFPTAKSKTWAFPGNEAMEKLYADCERLLKQQTGATWISTKPISGASAMTTGLCALSAPGDTIATIAPQNGGHTITELQANRLGREVVFLPYRDDALTENIDALEHFFATQHTSLVYLDKCHTLFPYDLPRLRAAIPKHIPIYYDGSHVMGLIFGNQFNDPLTEGATILAGSTHKTIPGPHKAFIATNNDEHAIAIADTASAFVSHDHPADTAALVCTLLEMEDQWDEYADRTIGNAQVLGKHLHQGGLDVFAADRNYTASHQLWVDTAPHINAYDAVMKLARCGVITNTFIAPSLPERLSIRLGVQEVTYLGATTEHIKNIGDIILDCLFARSSVEALVVRTQEIKQALRSTVTHDDLERIHSFLKN